MSESVSEAVSQEEEDSEFQDFTAYERSLWWDVLLQPFDKWPRVMRWVISDIGFAVAQNMKPALVEEMAELKDDGFAQAMLDAPLALAEGVPRPPGYDHGSTLQGIYENLEEQGLLDDSLRQLAAFIAIPAQDNVVRWIWEVAATRPELDGLELRRAVCNQLQAEIDAGGDCSGWVIFMSWVLYCRKSGSRKTWKQWSKTTDGSEALSAGMDSFMAWRAMRSRKEQAVVSDREQPKREAGPLGLETEHEPPMSVL